jgi:hypothetical protein
MRIERVIAAGLLVVGGLQGYDTFTLHNQAQQKFDEANNPPTTADVKNTNSLTDEANRSEGQALINLGITIIWVGAAGTIYAIDNIRKIKSPTPPVVKS